MLIFCIFTLTLAHIVIRNPTVPFIYFKETTWLTKMVYLFYTCDYYFCIYKSCHVNNNTLTRKLLCKLKPLLQPIFMVSIIYSCILQYNLQMFHLIYTIIICIFAKYHVMLLVKLTLSVNVCKYAIILIIKKEYLFRINWNDTV